MWTSKFWAATATRTVRTGAQVLLGFVVVDVAVWDIDWAQAGGVTVTAMLASILMSIAGPAGPDKETGDVGAIPDSAPVHAQRDAVGILDLTTSPDEAGYEGKRRKENREAPPGGETGEPRL